MAPLPILVEATRGDVPLPEIRHAGVIAVVAGDGDPLASVGDVARPYPLRSTAKPYQLLPYLLDGLHHEHPRGKDELDADLAIMMASHGGERMHTRRVAAILDAWGLDPAALRCGAHWPYHAPSRDALLCAGEKPRVLHSNCSGKHAAMLAVCKRRGWPMKSYIEADHPLQRRIHALLASLGGKHGESLPYSIDGCALPTWWLSVRGLARLYALLAWPQAAAVAPEPGVGEALAKLFAAGAAHPEMIAGTDRLDTRLMASFDRRIFAKSGAAGLYAMAVAPTGDYPTGLGIALKIDDGDTDGRARAVVACEVLRQLGLEPEKKSRGELLETIADTSILNVSGTRVGEYRPSFSLR